MSGNIGIIPVVEAIKKQKQIGLANKEVLVSAGSIIMPLAKAYGVKILPIDSEHSAIFQCLDKKNIEDVKRVIITASGGPFRNFSKDMLKNVSLKQALNHPTYSMGKKNLDRFIYFDEQRA